MGVFHLPGKRGDDPAVRALFGQPATPGSQSNFPDLDARTSRSGVRRMVMARRKDGTDADRRRRGGGRRRSAAAGRKPQSFSIFRSFLTSNRPGTPRALMLARSLSPLVATTPFKTS